MRDSMEFRHNLDHTDPELVSLCYDVHWVYRGGVDPVALLNQYAVRCKMLHLRQSHKGIWTEFLGDGDVDYRQVAEVLHGANFEGWLFVELAIETKTQFTRPLKENARLSREYVRAMFAA